MVRVQLSDSNHGAQAVVVSIDPKRVYVNDPLDVPMELVELQEDDKGGFGPNGENTVGGKPR